MLCVRVLSNEIFTRYVEQLVASAEAAVEEVIRRGVSVFLYPTFMSVVYLK